MGRVFQRAEEYLSQFDPESIGHFVEIGTSRSGDDGSTSTIAAWAGRFRRQLFTVDIDINNCNYVLDQQIPNVEVICQTGESYLKIFPGHIAQISFLYLDNFDWDWHPEKSEDFIIEQQKRYADLGFQMNNLNSQRAHLEQAVLALKHMSDQALVVCDDTWFNPWWGHYTGKSGAVVPLLLNNGFEVLYTAGDPEYGTILGRGIK